MKTILIEVVANGYIVSDKYITFMPIKLYTSLADLQSDLPNLLDEPTQFLPTPHRNAVPLTATKGGDVQ